MRLPFSEVIIACFSADISRHMSDLLRENYPSLTITAICNSAADAMRAIFSTETPPSRLIFTDNALLSTNPGFIHHIKQLSSRTYCFYIAEQPDFLMLRNALRAGVDDCLLLPFAPHQLQEAFDRIMKLLEPADSKIPNEPTEASRYLFWRNDVRKLAHTHMSINEANKTYNTHFAEGLFRAVFVELSSPYRAESVVDNRDFEDSIIRMSSSILQADCYDILYNRHANGVSMLLNYAVSKRGHLVRLIDQLFFGLRREFALKGIEVTMAIGRIYTDFSKLADAKQEILDARWAKRQIGSSRIINAEDIIENDYSPDLKHKMQENRALILHYFELLDHKRAIECIDSFFDTVAEKLPIRDIRTFSRFLLDFLFHTYNAELAPYGNPDNLRHNYIAKESTASTVESFHRVVVENIMDLMDKIELVTRRQYSQPIRDCMAILASKQLTDIHLEELAAKTHLSPQYLSSLFHQETGRTITAYIQEQRLKLAQSLLSQSDQSIAEISVSIGMNDPHYFSKFFKTHMKMTPLEYRRLKQS